MIPVFLGVKNTGIAYTWKNYQTMFWYWKKCIFAVLEPAKPLYDAQMCGSFFLFEDKVKIMETKIPYGKTFKSSSELVNLLKSRGLLVYNPELAAKYVENIGYYRLSAYMYPLLLKPKTDHRYKAGASFDQVLMLYRFDKKTARFDFQRNRKNRNRCTQCYCWNRM